MPVLQKLLDQQRHGHGSEAARRGVMASQLRNRAPETCQHTIAPAMKAFVCLVSREHVKSLPFHSDAPLGL